MDKETPNGQRRRAQERWPLTKEKILMFCGLGLIIYESTLAERLGSQFHFEILLAGLALCGVSIAQWGDKK